MFRVRRLLFVALATVMLLSLGLPALAQQDDDDIVSVLREDERFTTLVEALEAADLIETLQEPGPYTLFAPTNEAFEELPEGVLDDLLDNPDQLREVLLYHVVEGQVLAEDLSDGDTPTTVQGEDLEVAIDDDDVMINDANVVEADVEASNGVIHAIDSVLLPEAAQVEPEATPGVTPEVTPGVTPEATPEEPDALPELGGPSPWALLLVVAGAVVLLGGLALSSARRTR